MNMESIGNIDRGTLPQGAIRRRVVTSLLVTTSVPTSGTNVTASGGAITLLCPRSGAIQCSTRIHGGDLQQSSSNSNGTVGVTHLSHFGRDHVESSPSSSSSLAIAYGSSTNAHKKRGRNEVEDSYGMLLTIRRESTTSPAAPPIFHWKCRLPEPNMSGGLLVSPVTSRHVIGGGSTGTIYVWDVLQEGCLVRTVPNAHYRSITTMIWSCVAANTAMSTSSPCDAMLCTGSADGMVHAFSHIDIVEYPTTASQTSSSRNSIQPIRTWAKHQLAVTALVSLSGGRIASASEDGQIVIMEICSGVTIATIQLPDGIRSLTATDAHQQHLGYRLFAGGMKGTVYVVDMDIYAIHQTVQLGATIVHDKRQGQEISLEDRVFGSNDASNTTDDPYSVYQTELRGHDCSVTSLLVFDEENEGIDSGTYTEFLVSGDKSGAVRIWDTRRGCCLRVVYPWSLGIPEPNSVEQSNATAGTTLASVHPVTTIGILRDETDPFELTAAGMEAGAMFGGATHNPRTKNSLSFGGMISPLQKFSSFQDGRKRSVAVPFVQPNRSNVTRNFWDLSSGAEVFERTIKRGRQRPSAVVDNGNPVDDKAQRMLNAELERLRKELSDAKETIGRWEVVNNQLMNKLQ